MSKVKCPDCGRTVSSDALSCPHCGCPGSRIKSKASCQTIIGLIVFAVIIAGIMGNKDEDKSKLTENKEQNVEAISNEVNETPKIKSMYDNECVDSSYANDEEAIFDVETIESPEYEQEDTTEIIVNEGIESYIDLTED